MGPALKLDRLAQLRAELEGGLSEAAMLEREQLDTASWRESCAHWEAKLAEEAAANRCVLANRYSTAFNTTRRLLAAKQKRLEPAGDSEHPLGSAHLVDGGTTVGVDRAVLLREILPFRQGPAPTQPTPLPIDPSSTAEVDINSAALGAALPFLAALREQHRSEVERQSAAPAAPGRLTLEHFAALTAQVASAPDDASGIRARWQLDEASHRAESEHWQRECAREPALLARYAELVRSYRAAYRGRR